jgi:surface antigen
VHQALYGVALAATVASGLGLCGCSYRLASLVSQSDSDTMTTGSIAAQVVPEARVAGMSSAVESDLTYARAAAADVLARGGKDSSMPWENPQTGAGGNITPLDTAYSEGGEPCRDFLASYVHGGSQDWLQGAGCRTLQGPWEVKRLKPLKPH